MSSQSCTDPCSIHPISLIPILHGSVFGPSIPLNPDPHGIGSYPPIYVRSNRSPKPTAEEVNRANMNPLLRSAVRCVLRPAARRACEAQRRCSERERAIAEVKRMTRDHLRARDSAAAKYSHLPMYNGVMCGVLIATVIHLFKPREKSSQEIWLENNAKSREGSGAN